MTDWVLYEISLYDQKGNFVKRYACVPPFTTAPDVVVAADRYFVLTEDMTYHEARGVHFLPAEKQA